MEEDKSIIEDDDGELTTNQIKLKAQEIAKRFEKYQGRYHTSSSRCNTPLPFNQADSIESLHSNSVSTDTSEKVVLFRQFLENDRKLVENSKIDELKYNDDNQANNVKLLNAQLPNEKTQVDSKYYDDIISAQLHDKSIQLLKNQIVELNEKLENCKNIISEKDALLQSKNDKIESLNNSSKQKNKLHLKTVEELQSKNVEIVREERLRYTQKIKHVTEETAELKKNLEHVHKLCDELKKNNLKINDENAELRKKDVKQKLKIEKLISSYETEKKLLQNNYNESLKESINDTEKDMLRLQEENDSLLKRLTLAENNSMNTQEKDNLLTQLNNMEKDMLRLQEENDSLLKRLTLAENNSMNTQEKDNLLTQLNDMEKDILHLRQENGSIKERLTLAENNSMNTQEKDNLVTQLNNMEKDMLCLQEENGSLMERLTLAENNSMNTQEKDNLLTQLNDMEKDILHLRQENGSLMERLTLAENNSMNTQEKDNLLTQLDNMGKNMLGLQKENDSLMKRLTSTEYNNSMVTQENDHLLDQLDNVGKNMLQLQQEKDSLLKRLNLAENNSMNTQEKDHLLSQLNNMEKDILHLQQENESLMQRLTLAENSSMNTQEKDILSTQLDNMEKDMLRLQEENDSLIKRLTLAENNSLNTQENDNLSTQLAMKETEIERINLENEALIKQLQNQAIEVQQTENRWVQLKEAYLNDKNRMQLFEKVVDELKMSNEELNNTNLELTEQLERSVQNVTMLKTENNAHQVQITNLMSVIENVREEYEKTMKETCAQYEMNKKQLIQQHESNTILLSTCHNELQTHTSKLHEIIKQLNIALKENDSFKYEHLEFNNILGKSDKQMLELSNVINELHNHTSHMIDELKVLKKENIVLNEKLSTTSFESEENKALIDRFKKQKQLLKIKVKALKESENNCLLLKQKVESLTEEVQVLNKKSDCLLQSNKKMSSVLQNCNYELQECNGLLNETVMKSNAQSQSIHLLRCVLMSLVSLLSFNDDNVNIFDVELSEVVDSICNVFSNDNELQICLKKIIFNSMYLLEYTMSLSNELKHSKVQQITPIEVEKLVSEAVEEVKLSTQNEYQIKISQLHSLTEQLQNENHMLKLNISTCIPSTQEVSINLNSSTIKNSYDFENNVNTNNNIIHENIQLKQFLKNVRSIFGLNDISEEETVQLQNSLSELELLVQEIKNENISIKNQLNNLEHTIELTKCTSLNKESSFTQPVESFKNNSNSDPNFDIERKLSSNVEDINQSNTSNSAADPNLVSGDTKTLLARYKNLKLRFKEVRTKTNDLEKKIGMLTNDLECANAKYKQLNDQHVHSNEIHEADMAHCQTEIENLMCEKLEANRLLTALKEKHEILQNDYEQLKSNLDDQNVCEIETNSTHKSEQDAVFKKKFDETQHLIDTAYSKVLCEWPPVDTDSDWIVVQSKKLDKIVNAKCTSSNNTCDINLGESEFIRLETCVRIIHELVASILNNKCTIEVSPPNVLVDIMTDLKTCTETFLESMSIESTKSHSGDKFRNKLSHDTEDHDSTTNMSKLPSSSESTLVNPSTLTNETIKSSSLGNEENQQFQQSISERDRLIDFLTQKISNLENLNRSIEDIKLVRDKLDKALTAIHERDIRCDELTLELTRLLEERDMLQLKLSNAIRQIQFLSDNKQQLGTSNLLEEKYDSDTIDHKLEELHSLEYKRDAHLYTDQEQRHMSQMQLHQSHQDGSTTLEAKPNNNTEESSTSLSWIRDILW